MSWCGQNLVAQMGQLGVVIPEKQLLEAALQKLEAFQARAQEAVGGRPSRPQLAALQQVNPPAQLVNYSYIRHVHYHHHQMCLYTRLYCTSSGLIFSHLADLS